MGVGNPAREGFLVEVGFEISDLQTEATNCVGRFPESLHPVIRVFSWEGERPGLFQWQFNYFIQMGTSLKVLESGRGFESCVRTFLWRKQVQVPSSRGKSLMGVSRIPDEYFNYWPGHREERGGGEAQHYCFLQFFNWQKWLTLPGHQTKSKLRASSHNKAPLVHVEVKTKGNSGLFSVVVRVIRVPLSFPCGQWPEMAFSRRPTQSLKMQISP